MNLRLREQTMLLVALAITFFVLTMIKVNNTNNKTLQSRSSVLLGVSLFVLVLDLVKLPKQMKRVFCCLSGLALVFAGLAVLLNFMDKFTGTIDHLQTPINMGPYDKTQRVAAIVGTVGAGLALVVGATHLLQCVA